MLLNNMLQTFISKIKKNGKVLATIFKHWLSLIRKDFIITIQIFRYKLNIN